MSSEWLFQREMKRAETGDIEAQAQVGMLLEEGRGTPADPEEAARWYRRAAEQGSKGAIFGLAIQLFAPDERERRLQGLLDAVRDRYSAPALLWGRCADPHGRYTGAKIAYQSFPDAARLRWLGII